MKKITLKVKGMHCKSCSMLIEDALEDLGVKSKVDSDKGTAIVEFDENKVSEEAIKKAIKAEGYKVE
jgi:copper chaperone